MPRHPRTIWKPVYLDVLSIDDTSAPEVAFFSAVRKVDADASQGLQLKHIELSMAVGLTHTGTLDNTHSIAGFVGFFKWPADAATPTLSTVDLKNRTKIFGRRVFTAMGTQPRTIRVAIKTARLTLGEELWVFNNKTNETDPGILMHTLGVVSHWETEA